MKVTVFFDGGTRIAHGVAAGGAVVYDDRGNELLARAKFLPGVTTNNVAEYTGLHLGLELAAELGADEVVVFGDSEVVVRQVRGDYKTRKAHLVPLRDRAWELGSVFAKVTIKEAPKARKNGSRSQEMRRRNNNARADELCGQAMDARADVL